MCSFDATARYARLSGPTHVGVMIASDARHGDKFVAPYVLRNLAARTALQARAWGAGLPWLRLGVSQTRDLKRGTELSRSDTVLPTALSCPNCKVAEQQRHLTVRELERLKLPERAEMAANFDAAQRCGKCGATYVYSRPHQVIEFTLKRTLPQRHL